MKHNDTYIKRTPAAAIMTMATTKPMTMPAITPGSIEGPLLTYFPSEVGDKVGDKDIAVVTRRN